MPSFVYGYPSSCPRAHCTPNKSAPTLRYTRRPGPVYIQAMPIGTYRVQSPGLQKLVYCMIETLLSVFQQRNQWKRRNDSVCAVCIFSEWWSRVIYVNTEEKERCRLYLAAGMVVMSTAASMRCSDVSFLSSLEANVSADIARTPLTSNEFWDTGERTEKQSWNFFLLFLLLLFFQYKKFVVILAIVDCSRNTIFKLSTENTHKNRFMFFYVSD